MDEKFCCKVEVCDCYCTGFGDPHYITFDGEYYSHQGNCTYLLVEEIRPNYDNFKIYIDNVHCDIRDRVSCPRSIIVSFESQVIELKNMETNGRVKLKVFVNSKEEHLPFKRFGMKVYSSGLNLILEIPEAEIEVTFNGVAFTIKLPYQKFGNNTQGQCGTCNNNRADDCLLPGGQLVDSCEVMADYWLVNDPNKAHCTPPTLLPTVPPSKPTVKPTGVPCTANSLCQIIKSSVFEDCHKLLSPDPYYNACIFDGCQMPDTDIECSSLQNYASMCSSVGVCLYWRNFTNNRCPSTCPKTKIYKPCGPVEQDTCTQRSTEVSKLKTEGCFCPNGTTLFSPNSDICVKKCGCLDPNNVPREFGETFVYNCQDCTCDEDTKTVTCVDHSCPVIPEPNCNDPGFVLSNETSVDNPCCTELICRCNISLCKPNDLKCSTGFQLVTKIEEGKCCPVYTCEPKDVCVLNSVEYQVGVPVPLDKCQTCVCSQEIDPKEKLHIINCVPVKCVETCEPGFKYHPSKEECCGKCTQEQCYIQYNGTNQLIKPGETWSPAHDKCSVHSCIHIKDTFISTVANIVCPTFHPENCQPGTIQTAPDGCCKTCLEKNKSCKLQTTTTFITDRGCKSLQPIDMTFCEGACDTYSKYSASAANMQHRCTCCQEVKTHNETISLACDDGTIKPYNYIYVDKCDCRTTSCGPDFRRTRTRRYLPKTASEEFP
ncbi:MUC2 protein, partial [Polypterus senegalus]|nr:MUC2 protein [Polypterus senegalus]